MSPISTVVFYLDEQGKANSVEFSGDAIDVLGPAMKKAEELRQAGFRHVSLSTENSMSVGKPGVDTTDSNYNWKKRR